MFNDNFYPTPADVALQMVRKLSTLDAHGLILEPSAGKGDLLDVLMKHTEAFNILNRYRDNRENPLTAVHCCEINPDLQNVLLGKGYRVVASDFLAYHPFTKYSAIIMNPPFSNADDHILHAYDMLEAGGRLVALCNAETVNNPHTYSRKQLMKLNPTVDYLDEAFANAERRTSVKVTLLTIRKPNQTQQTNHFDDVYFSGAHAESEPTSAAPLTLREGLIPILVKQYTIAVGNMREIARLNAEMDTVLKANATQMVHDEAGNSWYVPKLNLKIPSLQSAVDDIRNQFWDFVLHRTGVLKMPKVWLEKFENRRYSQRFMDFTEENIFGLLKYLAENRGQMTQAAYVAVFDLVTSWSDKNTTINEKYKSNGRWKIKPRIIIPHGVEFKKWGFTWNYRWRRDRDLADLDLVCAAIAEKDVKEIASIEKAVDAAMKTYPDETESEFFRVKVMKTGTVHLMWKDQHILDEFNRRAHAGKNWLGDGEPMPKPKRANKRKSAA